MPVDADRLRGLLTTAGFAFCGVMVGYSLSGSRAAEPIAVPKTDSSGQELRQDLAALTSEVRQLAASNAQLRTRLQATEATGAAAGGVQQVDRGDEGSPSMSDEQRSEYRRRALAEAFDRLADRDDSAARESAFVQAAAETAFADHPLLGVECRENLCRVELGSPTPAITSFDELSMHPLFAGESYAHMDGKDRMVVYVADAGTALPDLTPRL